MIGEIAFKEKKLQYHVGRHKRILMTAAVKLLI